MELREFGIERYKGYSEPAKVVLAPLTILVGSNNAGKTVLAQAIQLLAGGLSPTAKDPSEPLPLQSGGIHHGETFEDLVTGRTVHGWLRLSATLADKRRELSFSATVRNVVAPNRPSERQIAHWSLSDSGNFCTKLKTAGTCGTQRTSWIPMHLKPQNGYEIEEAKAIGCGKCSPHQFSVMPGPWLRTVGVSE